MEEPIKAKAEISIKEPLNIVIETKENEKKAGKQFLKSAAGLDFIKWVIGTALLGGVGLYISSSHQDAELDLKMFDADVKLITSINFDTTAFVQLKSLYSIQAFIRTKNAKEIVENRIDSLRSIFINPSTNFANYIDSSEQIAKSMISPQMKAKLTVIQNRDKISVSGVEKPISSLKISEDSIIGSLNLPPIDSLAIKKIFETNILKSDPVSDNYLLQDPPKTRWCKEGYYVEYNNTLRIGINELNVKPEQIIVNFKDIENNKEDVIAINNKKTFAINVGQTFTLDDKNYRYQITLNYIGAAGKNPFTKAAYITVATYKKS